MNAERLILAIESSCDETAAAVLSSPLTIHSSVVRTQMEAHRVYGGVVPELASREHTQAIAPVMEEAMQQAGVRWDQLTGIAATRGPGLASSLMVGYGAAQALAWRLSLPLFGVHHMEGHLLSLFLAEDAPPPSELGPVLTLLVTGGHTALVRMERPGVYEVLGRSLDDAAGEALDKGAKMLGLSYPGGPEIERLACGDHEPLDLRFPLGMPRGEKAQERAGRYPFSFSGLKTALLYHVRDHPDHEKAAVASAYQTAVMKTLLGRLEQALCEQSDLSAFACVGGVAKNQVLRSGLEALSKKYSKPLMLVPMPYCTDNAAMIAAVPLLREVIPCDPTDEIHPNLALEGARLR